MFRDTDGNTMTYIPITGLIEGELSQVYKAVHDTPLDGELTGTLDARAHIWARISGVGSYQNISEDTGGHYRARLLFKPLSSSDWPDVLDIPSSGT